MTPPVFAHGHLRLYLLSLLEERPMHGYELIQALEARFGGTYSPSAGTIYPRLGKLEEDGLVTRVSDGRKSVYEITDAGRAEVDSRREELAGVEAAVTNTVRHLADDVRSSVDSAMRTLRAELAVAARDARAAAVDVGLIEATGESPVTTSAEPPVSGTEEPAVKSTDSASERAAGRRRLEEAELLIATFRSDLRAELHSRFAATDVFTASALEEVRVALDTASARIHSALQSSTPNH